MQKIETGISELLKRQPVTEQEKDAYIQDLQKALRLLLEEVRDLCKNRHPSPICTLFEHHPAGI